MRHMHTLLLLLIGLGAMSGCDKPARRGPSPRCLRSHVESAGMNCYTFGRNTTCTPTQTTICDEYESFEVMKCRLQPDLCPQPEPQPPEPPAQPAGPSADPDEGPDPTEPEGSAPGQAQAVPAVEVVVMPEQQIGGDVPAVEVVVMPEQQIEGPAGSRGSRGL